jgi:hypothetical protein
VAHEGCRFSSLLHSISITLRFYSHQVFFLITCPRSHRSSTSKPTNKSLASAGRRSQGLFAYPLFFDAALISIVSRIEVIKSLPSSELPRKTTQTSSAVDNGVRDPDELNLVASSMLILMTLTVLATHHRVQRGPVQEAPPTPPRLQTRCQLC